MCVEGNGTHPEQRNEVEGQWCADYRNVDEARRRAMPEVCCVEIEVVDDHEQ